MVHPHDEHSDSPFVQHAARVGLAARGFAHLLIGAVALLVAQGTAVSITQRSALTRILLQPYGVVLVSCIAVGFVSYALWRFAEAFTGVVGHGQRLLPRVQSFLLGVLALSVASSSVGLLIGTRRSPWNAEDAYSARMAAAPAGRWMLAALGLGILAFGGFLLWQALAGRFMRDFSTTSPRVSVLIRVAGTVGIGARAFVFMVSGTLFAVGAWNVRPIAAAGMDGAVNAIKTWPLGDALVMATAWGLIAFGCFGLCEALYRRV